MFSKRKAIFARPTPSGRQISYEHGDSRRTINLNKSVDKTEHPPVAAESFSLEAAAYEEFMKRVEALQDIRS